MAVSVAVRSIMVTARSRVAGGRSSDVLKDAEHVDVGQPCGPGRFSVEVGVGSDAGCVIRVCQATTFGPLVLHPQTQ